MVLTLLSPLVSLTLGPSAEVSELTVKGSPGLSAPQLPCLSSPRPSCALQVYMRALPGGQLLKRHCELYFRSQQARPKESGTPPWGIHLQVNFWALPGVGPV